MTFVHYSARLRVDALHAPTINRCTHSIKSSWRLLQCIYRNALHACTDRTLTHTPDRCQSSRYGSTSKPTVEQEKKLAPREKAEGVSTDSVGMPLMAETIKKRSRHTTTAKKSSQFNQTRSCALTLNEDVLGHLGAHVGVALLLRHEHT